MFESKSSFHPVLDVSNIKTHVSVKLEMETVHYATWAELFKICCRAHKILHHIIPPKDGKRKKLTSDADKELWDTLDATIFGWIYATISTDLLHTIMELDSTAMSAWERLRDIFQNNQTLALLHWSRSSQPLT
ncbi:hypothetical protein K7X08_006194 [Anisodus acutangulus]|uniref:Uncharacterized protein n=1 Tax=Anisodus acutangulus TaxID=402998 RepID=A0A9Q1MVB2_9SOLA|nr:hypothetical protein K7X08_006194 [Anisodus acutangulus]